MHRFLRRAHRLVTEAPVSSQPAPSEQLRLLHVTIKRVRAWRPRGTFRHCTALQCGGRNEILQLPAQAQTLTMEVGSPGL